MSQSPQKSFPYSKLGLLSDKPIAIYDTDGNIVWHSQSFDDYLQNKSIEFQRRNLIELLLLLNADDTGLEYAGNIIAQSQRVTQSEAKTFQDNDQTKNYTLIPLGDPFTESTAPIIAFTIQDIRSGNHISLDKIKSNDDNDSLNNFIESYPSGSITITDLDFKILALGGGGFAKHGFNKQNYLGKPISSLLREGTYQPIKKNKDLLLDGKSFEHKVFFDDSMYMVTGHPILDKSGKPEKFAITAVDVTGIAHESTSFKRLSDIFDRSLNEIYVFDEETLLFTDVNNGALSNIGYTKQEMQAMTPIDIKPTMDDEKFNEVIKPLRDRTVSKLEFETIHQRKDGSTYDVEVHLQLFDYPGEKVFVAIILDISARNKTKLELQRSEAFLKKSQSIAQLGNWVLDLDTRDTYYSKEFLRLNGLIEGDDPELKDLINKIHPDDRDMAREVLNQTVLSKEPYSIQFRIMSEYGEYIWINSTGEVYQDPDSNTLKMVGTYQDITELKNNQLEIAELNQKLGLALDSADIGIWERDFLNDIFVWDSNMYMIYGVDRQSYQPTPQSWEKFLDTDSNKIIEDFNKAVFESDEDYYESTYKIIRPDDTNAYIRSSAYIVRDNTGQPVKALGLDIDISDLKEAEIKAQKANNAKSDFLAQMTHELRTPLNGIIGYAEMLQGEELSKRAQKYSKIINDSGSYLLKLINEILDFSKIESGKMNLDISKVNIPDIASEAVQSVRYLSENSDVELMISISSKVRKFINTDEDKLVQILVNLMGNALKFTEHGYVRLSIRKHDNDSNEKIRFVVEDTGKGIPKDKQASIFDKFSQFNGSELQKGTGLGLNIAERYVRALGSKLKFNSIEGEGSTFYFDLDPAYFNSQNIVNDKSISDSRKIDYAFNEEDIKDGLSVLIVEDNAVNMLLTNTLIKSILPDITIYKAEDGSEAISEFLDKRPSFILMDLRMPKMNGIEAAAAIRALPEGKQLPIIALTASALKDKKEETERAGMNDFLTKPITKASMEKFLSKLLPSKQIGDTKKKETDNYIPFEYSEENLLESLDGDEELLLSLMHSAKNYLLELPVGIEFALLKDDREKVKELSHKLSGMASNIGFTQLADVATYIEHNSKIPVKELREEINALRQATDYYIDLIDNKYGETASS